jgi:D-proline reductase (dithiol) PrdB
MVVQPMARIDDIPEPTRSAILALEIVPATSGAFVAGPTLAQRRVAMVTSAALHPRNAPPFLPGSAEYRRLPADLPAADLVMSHVSINYDRTGWQRDVNTIYPLDRLRELAAEGAIGGITATHYSVMGSTDPATMRATATAMAAQMHAERCSAVLLCPV